MDLPNADTLEQIEYLLPFKRPVEVLSSVGIGGEREQLSCGSGTDSTPVVSETCKTRSWEN